MATKNKRDGTNTPTSMNKAVTHQAVTPGTQAAQKPPPKPLQGSTQAPAPPLATAAAPATKATKSTIRKGIYLSALIYVEGDMAPADDFAGPTTAALKSTLTSALSGDHGGLTMTLKKVEVQNDVEQDDGADQAGGKGGKFQF